MLRAAITAIVGRLTYCRHVLLRGWNLLMVPFLGLAVLQGIRDELPKEHQDKIPPLLGLLSWEGWIAVGLAVLLVVTLEGAYRATTEQRSVSTGAVSVRPYIDEGQALRVEAVTQGIDPPLARFDHWRIQVRHFLEDNFEGTYSMAWQERVSERARPQKGFTGMGTPQQIQLWNRIVSGVEWLEELER